MLGKPRIYLFSSTRFINSINVRSSLYSIFTLLLLDRDGTMMDFAYEA